MQLAFTIRFIESNIINYSIGTIIIIITIMTAIINMIIIIIIFISMQLLTKAKFVLQCLDVFFC